jgi:acyl-homoserine-lactone acylase
VFNANDSFWIPNADNPLSGDFSPLHGRQNTVRSLRTRQNASVLRDEKFSIDSLAATALNNVGYTATQLRAPVVERCQANPSADVDGTTVDLSTACAVLGAWDGTYELEAKGAALWREFLGRFDSSSFGPTGDLWAVPFDAARPVDTPSGLAPAPAAGPDPVLVHLAEAVQLMGTAGKALDTPLGEMQSADRNGEMVPIHGGTGLDGVTNVVGYSSKPGSTLEPIPKRGDTVAKGTGLTTDGYRINNGSSFMLAIDFGGGTLKAKVLLSYGNAQDRSNPVFVSSTQAFSTKSWRDVQLGEDWVKAQPGVTEKTVSA